jgi:hypothetical protein
MLRLSPGFSSGLHRQVVLGHPVLLSIAYATTIHVSTTALDSMTILEAFECALVAEGNLSGF